MKVSLSDQIAEQERRRDELNTLAKSTAEATGRLNAVEGTILTLRLLQAYEAPFREFMKQRTRNAA